MKWIKVSEGTPNTEGKYICKKKPVSNDDFYVDEVFYNNNKFQTAHTVLEWLDETDTSNNWISVEDRYPTQEDCFDDFYEVLTIQVGRKRPTMMKYWELKHCPFTKLWLAVPPLPNPPKQ